MGVTLIVLAGLLLVWYIYKINLNVSSKSCELLPDAGRCKAAFKKYYFDQATQSCQEFTWGGCGGTIPFETLEDCKHSC